MPRGARRICLQHTYVHVRLGTQMQLTALSASMPTTSGVHFLVKRVMTDYKYFIYLAIPLLAVEFCICLLIISKISCTFVILLLVRIAVGIIFADLEKRIFRH